MIKVGGSHKAMLVEGNNKHLYGVLPFWNTTVRNKIKLRTFEA